MKEETLLERLDAIVREKNVGSVIGAAIDRLKVKLGETPDELFVWETIALGSLADSIPSNIKSCWVFLIRAGIPPDKHRHPNSIQRTLAWRGSGDLQVWNGDGWATNLLVDSSDAPISQRWVSIPANAWHRPVVHSDWVVISFHEVKADELIEEAEKQGRKRKYGSG